MRLRIVRCPEEDAHVLSWIKANDCEHWSRKCPTKHKRHNLKRSASGWDVMANTYDDNRYLAYDEPKRYLGIWGDESEHEDMSRWIPAPLGLLVMCTHCDLRGAL